MLFHRFYGLEPVGPFGTFQATRSTNRPFPCDAKTLRARAAHCRTLAGTFYDQGIVTELEMFARELEAEAVALEAADRS